MFWASGVKFVHPLGARFCAQSFSKVSSPHDCCVAVFAQHQASRKLKHTFARFPFEPIGFQFMSSKNANGKRIVYGTTVGSSCWFFLRGQLQYFRQRGFDVHAVSSPSDYLRASGDREGVLTHAISMHREISLFHDVVALFRWIRLLAALRPDIVNVGTPKAALLGLSAAWLLRVPVRVYTVRGLRFETSTGKSRKLLIFVESLCCFLATHVVAVGHGVANELRGGSVTKSPILVIGLGSSNGVRGVEIADQADSLDLGLCRARWGLPTGSVVVGFVGRLTEDKGGASLISALRRLAQSRPDLRLSLLLVGPTEDESTVLSLENVDVLCVRTGWLDDAVPAMRAMDMLCLPTRREGYPNVVLEAGAVGIPVVTTDATGARESVIHGTTGYIVSVDDEASMARAIERLADSPLMRTEMGRTARMRVLNSFEPSRIWKSLECIYNKELSSDISIY